MRTSDARGGAATPAQPKPRPASREGGAAARPAEDACATRLHDLCAPLLLYFVANKRLPERLEDLAPFAEAGSDLQTTCPTSGRPYVYVPGGLPRSGSGRVLLVYDAAPAHAGVRWVIVASPPQGDQPLSMWVMPFTEARFRLHVPRSGGDSGRE